MSPLPSWASKDYMKTGTPISWNTDAPNEDLKTFRAKSRTKRKKNLLAFSPKVSLSRHTHSPKDRYRSNSVREDRAVSIRGQEPPRAFSLDRQRAELPAGPGASTHLCQLLGFVVERIHYFTHVLNCFQSSFISFIYWGFIENNQNTLPLVQDPCRKHKDNHGREVRDALRHISDTPAPQLPHFSRKDRKQNPPPGSIYACLLYTLSPGQ